MKTSADTKGRARPCRRRGFTLIEALAAIALVSIVLGLCATSIQLMFRLGNDALARSGAASSFGRLARQARADAHACVNARKIETARVELDMGNGRTVVYTGGAGSVTREVSADGKPARHERFAIGKKRTAAFSRRDDGPRAFLVLNVGQASSERPIEVLALIGKDRRKPFGGPKP